MLIGVSAGAFAATVSGHVVDASGTRALNGPQITLVELDRRANSDQDGRFRFADLPAGRYTLRIRYTGAQTVTETLQVGADEDLTKEFKLAGEGDAQLETINAVVQLGAFHKDIEDSIVYVQREDDTFNGVTVGEVTLPVNGEQATVDGLEFNYQQALTMLPSPFDGLLISFNYTYTDAQGAVDGRSIALPAASENVYSAALGTETVALVTGSNRSDKSISILALDHSTGQLRDVADGVQASGLAEPYGLCMYRDKAGAYYVFVNDKDCRYRQGELIVTAQGRVRIE